MSKKFKTAISPTREENYASWYQEVIKAAELAENSPVRGCMIIKPWGYALWEKIQQELDRQIKATNHENIYCPLFIPLSFLEKEAEHIAGFAKECAVITHKKLVKNDKGNLEPSDPLEEPLIVRPTSETIIGEAFGRWIQSYRDLPLLTNQWANVVRWEMRPRLFIRTSEFLWQEGHTAHATKEEAIEETRLMLEVYRKFCEDMLAIPMVTGLKGESEKFPGAEDTYTIEGLTQDKKSLQAGTSHFLGQNFSKAFSINFQNKNGEQEYAWTTSWGVTTRLIGALIMTHSDDNGLILPPRISPYHIVIIPRISNNNLDSIMEYCNNIKKSLESMEVLGQKFRVYIDKKDYGFSHTNWKWIKKGVPLRIVVGDRELEENSMCVSTRIPDFREKVMIKNEPEKLIIMLEKIQFDLLERSKDFYKKNTYRVKSVEEFEDLFSKEDSPGFVEAFWSEDEKVEQHLQQKFKLSVRCFPLYSDEKGSCLFTEKKGCSLALFARSY